MVDFFGMFDVGGDIIGNILNIFLMLGSVILVAAVIAVAWFSGFFGKKPFNVLVVMERAGGLVNLYPTKGQFKKSVGEGNFDIHDGLIKRVSVPAPTEEYIYPGDWIVFYRKASDDYRPIKLGINAEGNLDLDPALQPAMKLALAAQTEKSVMRLQEKNNFVQYFPAIAIIVSAVILGLAFIVGIGAANEPGMQIASSYQAIANKLADARVVIEYTNSTHSASQVTTVSGYLPPG